MIGTHINRVLHAQQSRRIAVGSDTKRSARIFWKEHRSVVPDLERLHLCNERSMLTTLATKLPSVTAAQYTIEVPQLVETEITPERIRFATRFFSGKRLEEFSIKTVRAVTADVIVYLTRLSGAIYLPETMLGKKTPLSLFITGIMYTLIAMLKNPTHVFGILRAGLQFVFLYAPRVIENVTLTLAHGDVDPHNLMVHGKRVLLADWENAIVTDPLFDLSQLPRLFASLLPVEETYALCAPHLKTQKEEQYYSALALYGCIASLALDQRKSHMHDDALAYLSYAFGPSASLYEIISSIAYRLLSVILSLLPVEVVSSSGGIVLCYHNVGFDSWRFTTPPRELEEHIKFLKKHYRIYPLHEVLKSHTGVAITFDDGYDGVVRYALPICKKYGVKPTVFVLGAPEQANRQELDNTLPLMDKHQVQELANLGWEIGFHTRTHAPIGSIRKHQLEKEIVTGKRESERYYGVSHRYFAYPKGVHSYGIEHFVKKAGFTAAFIVDGTSTRPSQGPYGYDRIPMERGTSVEKLRTLLSPAGMTLTRIFMYILRVKERVVAPARKALARTYVN